jgi:hypothetical protein
MTLSDNKTNTEYLYLFVEKFKWTSHIDTENFNGHPKPKGVYRAILNKDTGGYRVIYKFFNGNPVAFVINSLESNDEENGFVCKISTLDKNNILKFDISESDLDNMIGWIASDNKDLRDIMDQPDLVRSLPIPTDIKLSFPSPVEPDQELMEFFECALAARKVNPLLFDGIHELFHHIINEQPKETSVDATWITLSKNFGTGANIIKALEHIAQYAGENKRTNLDEYDLFEAIKHLLNEYTQRRFND